MRSGLWIAVVAAVVVAAACGDDNEAEPNTTPASEASFDEGTVRMEIEMLDTGLLKGHSYVDGNEGWTVDGVTVTAVTDDGTEWGVIEIKETGDADYVTFFEVQVQELPRGDQISVTTTAFFGNGAGIRSEHEVVDQWPP